MHRLPRDRMLNVRAAAGPVGSGELRKLVAKLAAFYSRTPRAPWDGPEYRRRLERHIRAHGEQLLAYGSLLGAGHIESVVAAELAMLRAGAESIEARCALGRVVDAHGDLRPEHILLDDEPQVIDCLEFSAELRLLDTAEEIAFLALECTQLGRVDLAREVLAVYRELCDDPVPQRLFDFYYVRRALVRALLCAWHLDEPLSEELRHHWRVRAKAYLQEALAASGGTSL
jgi:aminoglycoside phosphotransferase family enzyme